MDRPFVGLAIGPSDFRQIREQGRLYVDKTSLIQRVLEDAGQTLLLPRPRRFGKTTNMSTARYFLEKSDEDLSSLFADLAIWRWPGRDQHFQRYPVIYLSFSTVKKPTFAACLAAVADLLANLYREHHYLLSGGALLQAEAAEFTAIIEGRATQTRLESSLRDLSRYLSLHHRQNVVILLDEYDTPIHEAFKCDYYLEAIGFFRSLLTGCLKDNRYLFKAVLTGILRVAKESVFSDLNNLNVYSLLSPEFATDFGFTEPEVQDILHRTGSTRTMDELRSWYDGYRFGGEVIYNPWSVLNAIHRSRDPLQPYWSQTGTDDIIRELLWRSSDEQKEDLGRLLAGQGIRQPLVENIVLRDIYRLPEAVWSFLLFTGYLKVEQIEVIQRQVVGTLSLPNQEIQSVFERIFSSWLAQGLGGKAQVERMSQALLAGDLGTFEHHLSRLLLESASFQDTGGAPLKMPPEQVYQVFVLGLLVHLQPAYLVRSNREAGHGRSDVMIQPREAGRPGAVLELKVRRKGQTLQRALKEAQEQLRDRDYAAELRALGASPIHQVAVAFDGKHVLVTGVSPGPARKPRPRPARPKAPPRTGRAR
jgi:hypothetical protein